MDLVNWSMSAIDYIFSNRRPLQHEALCPKETYPSGYVMDTQGRGQMLCLSLLSVEDVEDLYLLGIMIFGLILGLLMMGACAYLMYRKLRELTEDVKVLRKKKNFTFGELEERKQRLEKRARGDADNNYCEEE